MSDEKTFVDVVFAAFGADDWEDGCTAVLLARTTPTDEEWEQILPSNPPPDADTSYAQGVHDGLRRFLVDPDGYIKQNISSTDPRHAALVEIAAAQKARDAAAAAASKPAAAPPATLEAARAAAKAADDSESLVVAAAAATPETTRGSRRLSYDPDLDSVPEPKSDSMPRTVAGEIAGALEHAASPRVGSKPADLLLALDPEAGRPTSDKHSDSRPARPHTTSAEDLWAAEDAAAARNRAWEEPGARTSRAVVGTSPITAEMRAVLEERAWRTLRQWALTAHADSMSEDDKLADQGSENLRKIRRRITVDKTGQNGTRNRNLAELLCLLLLDLRVGLKERDPDEFLVRYYAPSERQPKARW